jgi:hypothetical protein
MTTASRRATALLLAAAAALVDGCSCDTVPKGAVTSCEVTPPVPTSVRTDILFVIDDSGSMGEEQANLRTNLGNFIQALKDSPVANDYQIGVTTTSVASFNGTLTGAQGRLQGTPRVLSGSSPTLVADFQTRIAALTTSGSGKEQPLRAMKLALSSPLISPGGTNEGFLRSGARLAVVILSDEDDNSETLTNLADTNEKTHNDTPTTDAANRGRDYKFTVEDPVADYHAFLTGLIGPAGAQEVRDVAVAAIVGVDGQTGSPSCGDVSNNWCCGSGVNDTCAPGVCGSNVVTNPVGTPNLTSDTYCCGGTTGTVCTTPPAGRTCPTAYDKADRFTAFLSLFPPDRALTASICDASFADTLTQIGCMLVPQDVPLDGAPADWRMMTVALTGGAATIPCEIAVPGAANEATAGVVYHAPAGGQPATLHFQNSCRLGCGKRIEIALICAG